MTDNEIIKALECCLSDKSMCEKCPIQDECQKHPFEAVLVKYSFDLINRQKAEIERLRARCENTQIGYNFAKDEIRKLTKDKFKLQKALNQSEDYRAIAKTEAIKEFAERLISVSHPYADTQMVFEIQINNLVKEMVGDEG